VSAAGEKKPLRIGVDMVSAGSGFKSGAGGMINYYEGLLSALCEREDVASIVAFVSPSNVRLAVPSHPKIEAVICRGLPSGRTGRVIYEQTVLPILASRQTIDVLLCTVNIMPLLRRAPTVVVLQSIQYFLWPTEVGRLRGLYLRFFTPRSLARADGIVAVTETERTDALRLFDLDESKIAAVHHGIPNWAAAAHREELAPHELPDGAPYVLVVSRLYGFKNHRRLIEALALVRADPELPYHLVIAGGDADVTRADLEAHAARHGVSERVHCLGMVPQAQMPALFLGSAAIAYVSLYETFGLPVLEALSFGLPLVTSGAGATAEVAGDAAVLVNPHSVAEIASGLRAVLTDGDLRARLAEAGPQRVADFSWERCADGTMSVIRSALQRRTASDGVRVGPAREVTRG